MTIHFGKPTDLDSIKKAVPLYSNSEFESATRSTIPMLSLLAHEHRAFRSLVTEMRFPIHYHTYLEFTVSPKYGRGKASHTDVMLIDGRSSIAIEAKWTEGMYPTVNDWIKKGSKPDNRREVLRGWTEYLGDRLNKSLDPDDFGAAIYQMVHRAASAAEAGKQPAVAYFLFKMESVNRGASTKQITERLEEFWRLLGQPESFPCFVAEIGIAPTPIYEELQQVAEKESKKVLSESISAALQGDEALFLFDPKPVVEIGRNA